MITVKDYIQRYPCKPRRLADMLGKCYETEGRESSKAGEPFWLSQKTRFCYKFKYSYKHS